jgi:hypothetical protein
MNASREDDPVHTIRTIARISQMLIELRDEYVARPRQDTLLQIQQRLDDMLALKSELDAKIDLGSDTE